MEDLLKMVGDHLKKYPEMESNDIIKLIYQSEFGGGAYYYDPENAIDSIKCELEHVAYNANAKHDYVGNGLIRFNLTALPHDDESITRLVKYMALSLKDIRGDNEEFIEKLKLISEKISAKGFKQDVLDYIKNGCPYVHHSYIFKYTYDPSYRIISEKYLNLVLGKE